jgi:hypothetical protein
MKVAEVLVKDTFFADGDLPASSRRVVRQYHRVLTSALTVVAQTGR